MYEAPDEVDAVSSYLILISPYLSGHSLSSYIDNSIDTVYPSFLMIRFFSTHNHTQNFPHCISFAAFKFLYQ